MTVWSPSRAREQARAALSRIVRSKPRGDETPAARWIRRLLDDDASFNSREGLEAIIEKCPQAVKVPAELLEALEETRR